MSPDEPPRIVVNMVGITLGILQRPGPMLYSISNDLESLAEMNRYWMYIKYSSLQIVHVLGTVEEPEPRVQRRRGRAGRVFVGLSMEDMLQRDQSPPGKNSLDDPLYLRILEASLLGMLAATTGPSESTAWLLREYEDCRRSRLLMDEARGIGRK